MRERKNEREMDGHERKTQKTQAMKERDRERKREGRIANR